ncbi:MAG: hypothetical protein GXP54_09945 [Deltaproteobacteria bacterium]|nr:hypothetical protein [Deltaproteobacteria bacterium]
MGRRLYFNSSGVSDQIQSRQVVTADSPWFCGHFPDQPVFPGVGVLDLLHSHLMNGSSSLHPGAWSLHHVRFRKPVLPNEELRLSSAPTDHKGFLHAFRVRAADGHDATVCEGTFAFDGPGFADVIPPMPDPGAPPDLEVERFIPHRDRMKLVDGIIKVDQRQCIVSTRVRDSWPTALGNDVSSIITIELIAQASAVLDGWNTRAGSPDKGWPMLVGVRKAMILCERMRVGQRLSITANQRVDSRNYKVFEGMVLADTRLIATATIQAVDSGAKGGSWATN